MSQLTRFVHRVAPPPQSAARRLMSTDSAKSDVLENVKFYGGLLIVAGVVSKGLEYAGYGKDPAAKAFEDRKQEMEAAFAAAEKAYEAKNAS